ncbi:YtjB family periplasmic protein [Candidatus Enterovibrio altilux]|uniref:Smp-like protein n=1 Tax=Candidatus Enterovibrio altilux TaxID=1927128 RepID=A0A291B9K6_9GAMM|nr:AhpA/YtjB family protein [Candidatus Enterovibrio luxaltus]ATF09690.1 Smp-like protein [Candidatus Enterovibrio luxaltus]
MLQINKQRLRLLRQCFVVFTCFTTIILLFMYSTQLNNHNHHMLYEQTELLSRVILRQAANTAYSAVVNDEIEVLDSLVARLQADKLIFDATIYDQRGNRLVSSIGAMPLEQLAGISIPLSVASIGRHQLVEPIFRDGHMAGFVRITLEHAKIIKATSNRLEQNINLVRSMMLIAIITGGLLILAFANRNN